MAGRGLIAGAGDEEREPQVPPQHHDIRSRQHEACQFG